MRIGSFIAASMMLLAGGASAQSASEYNQLGVEAYDQNHFDAAVDYFENAYKLSPDSGPVLRNLVNARQAAAQALAQEGNFDAAVRHLERTTSLDPSNYSPHVQLGAYYLRLNMVPDAIFRLEEAIQLKPGQLDAHELLGEAYYRDNDLPSARVQWDYVLEVDPDRPGLKERYDKAFREESVEQDFNRAGSRHFAMTYPNEQAYASMRGTVLTLLERAYMEIGRSLERTFPPSQVQVIMYSAEQFSEATQLEGHVGAVYDGKIRAPLTDARGRILSESELKRRLTHEYVHVLVRQITNEKVPWWVNEGLAETLSRPMDGSRERELRKAYTSGVAFSLSQLEGQQLKKLSPDSLGLAYNQAHAAVSVLWSKFGQRRFKAFLDDLAAGTDTETALKRQFHKDYKTLDGELARIYGPRS